MSDSTPTTPEVTWAQRSLTTDLTRNYIYLTISAPDVLSSSCKIDLQPNSLTFTSYSDIKHLTYHVKLGLYREMNVAERGVLALAAKGEQHFLKTDFDKWVDEDEQDAAPEDDAMAGMGDMGGMGGMPGIPGMPGMGGIGGIGGLGGLGGFGGIDFSKIGDGAGGMPDMGDMPKDDDEGDDDMPGLEDEGAEEEEVEGKREREGRGGAEG